MGNYVIDNGDSGSPCLVDLGGGNYMMCCVVFGRDEDENSAFATPASVIEDVLKIRFGEEVDGPTGPKGDKGDRGPRGYPGLCDCYH